MKRYANFAFLAVQRFSARPAAARRIGNNSLTLIQSRPILIAMKSMDILFFTFALPARDARSGPRQCAH
ncbi:MAG: hypothetical protein ABIT83_00385 [Massilia sp.]